MTIVDDIRRDVGPSDYQQVIADFVEEFAGRGYGLYQYGGGKNPPVSDLDLLVLVSRHAWPSSVRRLHRDLAAFRTRDSLRQYLIDFEVRMCPIDLFRTINCVHPKVSPNDLRALAGPDVTVEEPARTPYWSGVTLIDLMLTELAMFHDLARHERVSLRALVSGLNKLPKIAFGELHAACHAHAWADDGLIEEAARLQRSITAFGDDALHPSGAAAIDCATADNVVHTAVQFVSHALDVLSRSFLGSVISSTGASMPASRALPGISSVPVPGLVAAHIALHHQAAHESSPLKRRLHDAGGDAHGLTAAPEYLAAIASRMRLVSEMERRFSRFGLPAFPVCIGGLWHTDVPPSRWDRFRGRLLTRPADTRAPA